MIQAIIGQSKGTIYIVLILGLTFTQVSEMWTAIFFGSWESDESFEVWYFLIVSMIIDASIWEIGTCKKNTQRLANPNNSVVISRRSTISSQVGELDYGEGLNYSG